MKRIVALVSLLLCLALVFGSCSIFNMGFKQLYRKYEHETAPAFASATEMTDIAKLSLENQRANLLAFETEAGETKFYNVDTATVVLTLGEDASYEMFSVMGYPFVKATEVTEGEDSVTWVRLYDAKGTKVAEAKDPEDANVIIRTDLFQFDNLIYRVDEEGKTEAITDNPLTSYLPDVDTKTKKFYYNIASDKVSAYNEDLECVFFWEVPFDEYEDSDIFLLSDGILLAQVFELLPDDAKKYDFVAEGEKMNVISYVLNAKSGNAKEVDLDFIVDDMESYEEIYSYTDEEDFLPKRVTNWAEIYYINDHRVDTRSTEVTIQNNGSVFKLAPEFDNVPYPIAEDRFIDRRDNGEVYLINGKGKVIANITGADIENANEKYVLADGKLYNFDLELVYDAEDKDQEVVRMLATSVILKEEKDGETKYFLFKDGANTEIKDYVSAEKQFYVTKTDGKFTFYAENGTSLITVEGTDWDIAYTSNDAAMMIICVQTADGARYYKLA